MTAGVPQGSILSPLLFNIYVNDIGRVVSGCRMLQYADDTVLFSGHLCAEEAVRMLQRDVLKVMDWFDLNMIKVNASKTKLVCFHNPLKVIKLKVPILLHSSNCVACCCVPVEYVSSVKYLGVFFDSDLSWTTHLSYITKRLRGISCLLYSTKVFMPFSVKKMIVYSLVYSVLRYGITLFANCSRLWRARVDSVLRGILKSLAYNSDFASSDNLFQSLELPSFYALFQHTVTLRYFWSNEYKVPHTTSRALRNIPRFEIPRCRTRFGECVRSYYIPHLFNDLPDCAYDVETKGNLKRILNKLYYYSR